MADHSRMTMKAKRRLDASQVQRLGREGEVNDSIVEDQQNGKHRADDKVIGSQCQATHPPAKNRIFQQIPKKDRT